jgi:hypothetical protein
MFLIQTLQTKSSKEKGTPNAIVFFIPFPRDSELMKQKEGKVSSRKQRINYKVVDTHLLLTLEDKILSTDHQKENNDEHKG